MFYGLVIFIYLSHSVSALTVKVFLPNTNYGNVHNWVNGQPPCEHSHVTFPNVSPKVFLNGTSVTYRVSEMILPFSGMIILDDSLTLTVAGDLHEESSSCDVVEAHYSKENPDLWYDPSNWCQTKNLYSPCLNKPWIEASIVPSSLDTVVFPRKNTFFVGLKPFEPKIVVKEVFFRGQMFRNTILFRNKIRRNRKENMMEFVIINSTSPNPPNIELQGNKCKGNMCDENSNIKRMMFICPYSTCRKISCQRPIHPKGSCCSLCGHMFTIKMENPYSIKQFERWFEEMMEDYYKTKLMFNVLLVHKSKAQVVISSFDVNEDVQDHLMDQIVDRIFTEFAKLITVAVSIEEKSWSSSSQEYSHQSSLITLLIIGLVLIFLIILFISRKKIPLFVKISDSIHFPKLPNLPKVNFPTFRFNFFQKTFPLTRLNEDVDGRSTTGSVMSAVEVIELPEKVIDVSFDNPIYEPEAGFKDSSQ